MERRCKTIDATRAHNKFDISVFNIIRDTISSGNNPLGQTTYSYGCTITTTVEDVFNYYRFIGKEFEIVLTGGRKHG